MSLNYSIANVVYVKNLSTDATEKDVREKFQHCNEILRVVFKNFPGLSQKYCEIEFKDSEGITKASKLNGELLLNVPMVVTVIEPVNTNLQNESNNNVDNGTVNSNDSNIITTNNVQNEPVQLQEPLDMYKTLSTNNTYEKFSRIVYMENIPINYNETLIKVLFKNIGKAVNCRMQHNEDKSMLCAFVEFSKKEEAQNALSLNGINVGNNQITIRDSLSLITEKDNMNINFSVFSNHDEQSNNSNNYLTNKVSKEKVEKVLALKEKLSLKLCAMYKPSLLLVNSLLQSNSLLNNTLTGEEPTTKSSLNQSIDESQINSQEYTEKQKKQERKDIEREEEKDKHKDIRKHKEKEKEREREKKKERSRKREKERDKEKEKDRHRKRRISETMESEQSSDQSDSDDSSSSHKRRKSYMKKKNRSKYKSRSRSRRKRHKYHSRSSSSSYYSSNSDYSDHSVSEKNKDKHGRRRRRKGRRSHDSSSSYFSRSSNVSKRKRSISKSRNKKPWWIKESEKMQRRQKMRERRMKEYWNGRRR